MAVIRFMSRVLGGSISENACKGLV